MFGLWGGRRHERAGYELYGAAVRAARAPYFYQDLAVADTLDGRFDMVGLHTFLLIRRLQAMPDPASALAQAVFDAMFNDMDVNLREMGVSDLGVGKRVRSMWEALHGRAAAYTPALDASDHGALAAALARNVWREAGGETGGMERSADLLADYVVAQDRHLATLGLDEIGAADPFLPAPTPAIA